MLSDASEEASVPHPQSYQTSGLLLVARHSLGSVLWELLMTASEITTQMSPRLFERGHSRLQAIRDTWKCFVEESMCVSVCVCVCGCVCVCV